ncbi:PepSY domain-containing protein [Bacillota bacterium Lsc_1132]
MNWKSFFLGAAVGLAGGYAIKEIIKQKTHVSPEKVLEYVKNEFKQSGGVSGSWIHMEAESYEKGMLQYQVYKGGITKQENGTKEQYMFIADATTGTILDVQRIFES